MAELGVDDESPFSLNGWTNFRHLNGLGVKSGDFNRDGVPDVVVGGNGPIPVKVIYLDFAASSLYVKGEEILDFPPPPAAPFQHTFACYGLDVGDYDDDGWDDIAVGRRLQQGEHLPPDNMRNTVFLNDGQLHPGVTQAKYFDEHPTNDLPAPPPPPAVQYENFLTTAGGVTFGIESASLNGLDGVPPTRKLDMITTGAYGIRYYIGNGDGTFTYVRTFTESGANAPYRNITFGDVDGDNDIDMYICRARPANLANEASDRIWFNQLVNPFPGVADQFALSPTGTSPVDIIRPARLQIEWRQLDSTGAVVACGLSPSTHGSFDAAFGDLDRDDDLDLVVCFEASRNAAYLNNGNGQFGSVNNIVPADGNPAYLFSTATPDWPDSAGGFAPSDYLYLHVDERYEASGTGSAFPPSGSSPEDFVFRVDGKLLDWTTSTRIADVDGDRIPDVAFANRNELQELCLKYTTLPYLNATDPVPPVYDHIVYNITDYRAQPGLLFRTCIELVGRANDGTSYIEFAHIGGSNAVDWIESNFNNEFYNDTFGNLIDTTNAGKNVDVWLGNVVPAAPWAACVEQP